jgi:hypothetical protein
MSNSENWGTVISLAAELKRCDECNLTIASLALSFMFIDTFTNISRPINKSKVTRSDFIEWSNTYIIGHHDQPYKYRGKDIYAARCAYLHTYGSEAQLHEDDPDLKKFGYHDGGKHMYNKDVDPSLVLIGVKSFVNDIINAGHAFMEECKTNTALRERVEARLPQVLIPIPIDR